MVKSWMMQLFLVQVDSVICESVSYFVAISSYVILGKRTCFVDRGGFICMLSSSHETSRMQSMPEPLASHDGSSSVCSWWLVCRASLRFAVSHTVTTPAFLRKCSLFTID